jgi:hypothetical protein
VIYTSFVYTCVVLLNVVQGMLKNITLTAEEALIAAARKKAAERRTTLNAEFRKWLAEFTETEAKARDRLERLDALFKATKGVSSGGRRFTRDEMNER